MSSGSALNAMSAVIGGPCVEDWKAVESALQKALDAQLPTGKKPYRAVHVLLWSFEGAHPLFAKEIMYLKRVFEDEFSFVCEYYEIPKRRSSLALSTHLLAWLSSVAEPDSLCIVYYGGHGKTSRDEKCIFTEGSSSIKWSGVHTDLAKAIKDVEGHILCILDCCYAAAAGMESEIELLAATGIDQPAQGPGLRSFTDCLISAMRTFGDECFSVAMLHGRMLQPRFRVHGGRTPIHIQRSDVYQPSVFLQRVKPPTLASAVAVPASLSTQKEPRVLVKFSLSSNAGHPDIKEWITYLTSHLPSHVEKGAVTVEGVWRSGSTMVLLALPVAVWNCMAPIPGSAFIHYVEGRNMLLEIAGTSRREDTRSDESEATMVGGPMSPSMGKEGFEPMIE